MTALNWKLAAQSASANGNGFGNFFSLTNIAAAVINGLGFWILSAPEYKNGGSPFLPIPGKLLVIIPLSALHLYIVCYNLDQILDYFRVWMHLVPLMFQSAAFLALLAIGFLGLRKQRKDVEQNL
ncbi:hypothetical protein OBV_00260 [Oscillibacter valericigenes Sjm18-20]|nr:hypothetical protein OBV_00260 [Oscillibacter valericigenes Sjm18-20]